MLTEMESTFGNQAISNMTMITSPVFLCLISLRLFSRQNWQLLARKACWIIRRYRKYCMMIRLVGHPVTFMSRGTVRCNQFLMNHSWKHHLDSFYISKAVRGPSLVVQSTYLNLGYAMYTCIPSKLQLWLESSSLTSRTEYYIFSMVSLPFSDTPIIPIEVCLWNSIICWWVKPIEIHCFWMVPAIKMSQQHAQCWMRSWLRSWSGRCCVFFAWKVR